eukprot:TRINITY_DN1438_c0_g1_i2.p1 TRINITY_DN1438_c0_g1~~TRINITY_DN1438_c0_g1_i2.p1  ORF type:complete len:233 (-),score=37.68 TRINITY_DN1438_c0_g1_i2:26-670(-)
MDRFRRDKSKLDRAMVDLNRAIKKLDRSTGANKTLQMSDVRERLDFNKGLLEDLNMQVRALPNRDVLSSDLRRHQFNLSEIEKSVSNMGGTSYGRSRTPEDREQLMRNDILKGRDRVNETGRLLNESVQIGLQSEEIGTAALDQLYTDREKLDNAEGVLDDVDNDINRARKKISIMGRRAITSNIILAFIILILISAICVIIFFKWIYPSIKHK